MASPQTALQRERLRLYRRIVGVSAVIGLCFGTVLAQTPYPTWISAIIGMLNGVAIAGCLAGIEIFLLRGAALKRLLRLPFVVVVAIKTVAYAGVEHVTLSFSCILHKRRGGPG